MSGENAGSSRSEFLKRTAGVTGLVVGAGVLARGAAAASQADPAPEAAAQPGPRAFSSGHFSLELDGTNAGLVKSFAGGDTRADVIEVSTGSDYFARKHPGRPEYDDFTVEVGLGMSDAFWEWISRTVTGQQPRHDGAIIAADSNFNAKSRRAFTDALIAEVAFPAMDASDKDAATMKVTFTSEFSHTDPASGKVTQPTTKQKQWQASNFKFEIDGGIDTSRVAKVDGFSVKQQIQLFQSGDDGRIRKLPGRLEFPNLRVTLAEQGSESWFAWFEDFVVQGHNSNADERSGRLRYLAPNLKDELAQVRFYNLGIYTIGAETMEAGAVKRVVAELYCERLELDVGPPAPNP